MLGEDPFEHTAGIGGLLLVQRARALPVGLEVLHYQHHGRHGRLIFGLEDRGLGSSQRGVIRPTQAQSHQGRGRRLPRWVQDDRRKQLLLGLRQDVGRPGPNSLGFLVQRVPRGGVPLGLGAQRILLQAGGQLLHDARPLDRHHADLNLYVDRPGPLRCLNLAQGIIGIVVLRNGNFQRVGVLGARRPPGRHAVRLGQQQPHRNLFGASFLRRLERLAGLDVVGRGEVSLRLRIVALPVVGVLPDVLSCRVQRPVEPVGPDRRLSPLKKPASGVLIEPPQTSSDP